MNTDPNESRTNKEIEHANDPIIEKCKHCEEENNQEDMREVDDTWLCEDCFEKEYEDCHECGKVIAVDSAIKCPRCKDMYCDDHIVSNHYTKHEYCDDCYDDYVNLLEDNGFGSEL